MQMKKLLFGASLARMLTVTTKNPVWMMPLLLDVSRFLQDDVCGEHEAQLCLQLLEIIFD